MFWQFSYFSIFFQLCVLYEDVSFRTAKAGWWISRDVLSQNTNLEWIYLSSPLSSLHCSVELQLRSVWQQTSVCLWSLSEGIGICGSLTRSSLNSPVLRLQAQLIAQSIGQAFSVAYQEFLRANGINPEDLSQKEYSDIINTQEMYNDDLIHFSNSENCKEVGPDEMCIRVFLLMLLGVLSKPVKNKKKKIRIQSCSRSIYRNTREYSKCWLIRQIWRQMAACFMSYIFLIVVTLTSSNIVAS